MSVGASGRRIVRNRARAAVMLVAGIAAFGMAMLVGFRAADDGEMVVALVGAVAFGACGVAALLYVRAGVAVDSDGVTIRSMLRSRRLEWDEILSFGLTSGRSRFGERLERPGVTLRNGEVFWIQGIEPPNVLAGIGARPAVFPEIDELERLRRENQGGSTRRPPR